MIESKIEEGIAPLFQNSISKLDWNIVGQGGENLRTYSELRFEIKFWNDYYVSIQTFSTIQIKILYLLWKNDNIDTNTLARFYCWFTIPMLLACEMSE